MLKTNTKAVIERLRAFILDNYTPESYGLAETSDFHQVAQNIIGAFYKEKVEHDNRRLTDQEYFLEWMAGLPSIIYTGYYLHESAVEILGDMLEETPAERKRYTEAQAQDMLSKLIYRELVKGIKWTH